MFIHGLLIKLLLIVDDVVLIVYLRITTVSNDELDIEDEYHFICTCKCYDVIRKLLQHLKYDKPDQQGKAAKTFYYRNPSVYKFNQLLNSKNKIDQKSSFH
jgi:hypothetical protein